MNYEMIVKDFSILTHLGSKLDPAEAVERAGLIKAFILSRRRQKRNHSCEWNV